jgi:hypothetical protein
VRDKLANGQKGPVGTGVKRGLCYDFVLCFSTFLEDLPAMQRFWFVMFLLVSLAGAPRAFSQAQAAKPAEAPKAQQPKPVPDQDQDDDDDDEKPTLKPSANVPAAEPVITIKGLCDSTKSAAGAPKTECKTVITRAEFEKMTNALQPNMAPQVKKQIANKYALSLLMSKDAQKRGLDKDPHYLETLRFVKMQLLSQELVRKMQEEGAKVPPQDIEDYYKKNGANYEQAAVQRVFVPKNKQMEVKDPQSEEYKNKMKDGEAAMAKEADDLRARAAAGEDFDKLQREAYEFAGIKNQPPSTTIPKVRRVNLPPTHVAVFDLKPGDVSSVIKDPSGSFFYKMQSKTMPQLDDVREEIRQTLQNQRTQESMQKLQNSITTDLNEAYFNGSPGPPAAPAVKPAANAKPADTDDKPAAKPAAQR